MSYNTLTFAMGGRIDIGQFQRGITRFQRLVSALSANTSIKWIIDDLQTGSAVATLRGEGKDPVEINKIIQAYNDIGKALELQQPISRSRRVDQAVEGIKSLAGSVEYIRFETQDGDHTVASDGSALHRRATLTSVGAVSGRIQTLTNRGSLRFNLYDTVHDKAVACYLQLGQEEVMRQAWGKLARVSDSVSRETATGLPVAIRQILEVVVLPDAEPGSYQAARGVVPWQPGDRMPEDVIRQLRDA